MDGSLFFAAWLAAAWFVLGISTGSLAWLWIHRLTGGRWGSVLRPHLRRLARAMPRVLLLFVPLAFGQTQLYPPFHAADSTPKDFVPVLAAWHAPSFLAARCIVYALVWLVLSHRARREPSSGEAAASLLIHLVVTTLASVDLLVALVPNWSSSIFGLMAVAGQAFAAIAAAIVLACRAGDVEATSCDTSSEEPPLGRDLGNLLLASMLVWAYLAFMQLLIIWAEDLPREISWYLPRLQTGWIDVGVALVLVHFALPLAALLFRAVKERPRRLALVAGVGLVGHAIDAAWLVIPSVAPHAMAAWWIVPLLLVVFSLLAFAGRGRRDVTHARATHSDQKELADGRA